MKPLISNVLLDELLKNYTQPSDLLGPDGLLTELKKRLINRILDSELTTHHRRRVSGWTHPGEIAQKLKGRHHRHRCHRRETRQKVPSRGHALGPESHGRSAGLAS